MTKKNSYERVALLLFPGALKSKKTKYQKYLNYLFQDYNCNFTAY